MRAAKPSSVPPSLAVVYRPLSELVPYAKNARRHSPGQIDKIKASLREFGWANAMLVAGNQMIAGHARLAAALALRAGGETIPHIADASLGPTIDLSHLTAVQRRAYVLADNRLAEEAIWDLDLLRGEIEGLKLDGGFDVGLAGFSAGEVDTILHGWNPDFGKHVATEAALDPLMTILRIKCRQADVAALQAAVLAAIAPFADATVMDPP